MNGHLSEEQWVAAVLRQSDEATAKHLGECSICLREVASFNSAAGAAREQARSAIAQPEIFWRRQRERISSRLATRAFVHPWKRWAWAIATVVLILLASTLISRNEPRVQSTEETDPDDALLLSVQQSIQSDLPRALGPAALLTREMSRRATTQK